MIKYIKYGAILVLIILSLLVLFISHFVLSYPVKYYNIIEKYALINNIDTEMVLSVINIESSFDEMSISKAGAIGLMQLKLETANDMAIRNKENIITKYQLYDPELNIKYGCKYLRYLIDYYNGNLILALCAYNAGLGNVNTWLKDKQYTNSDGVLIDIPYAETKIYIKKFEKNYKIYRLYNRFGIIKN